MKLNVNIIIVQAKLLGIAGPLFITNHTYNLWSLEFSKDILSSVMNLKHTFNTQS